ncbi:LysR family transcriptional regulator (chromosome initiation inhibitor) [Psychromicrobium silvestre]|uniref:LysR family transcriptional regulator (Chromosome initiation inhibitor) n=1 Tax=Psychromicrobium silvestre TaxID=1645614 RepID=A0A7Y9S890_9MICC|nr:LysR family transcriptional regulator ArgP [Psychromicrobium silvestre]NYE96634.1 LysR family transcriptional regulator (chromosome initiation inhibitor) [Psychromicrobium silvestre]
MLNVQLDQLRALNAIATHGSFEAAALELRVSQSAISQRMKALEKQLGRPVLWRNKPLRLTEPGEILLRFARQVELLGNEVLTELELEPGTEPALAVVVNADSLSTWALPALAELSSRQRLEILREDQDHSVELLREGRAVAAITSYAEPMPGCLSRRLGVMRYLPVCAPGFAAQWFDGGATVSALGLAPMVVFDRKDDLQDRYLRQRSAVPLEPPRNYIPSSHDFFRAVELGLGWGMLPEQQCLELLAGGSLQLLSEDHLDIQLYWQQWRLHSAALDAVAAGIITAAAELR